MSTSRGAGTPVHGFEDGDWTALLDAIRWNECTPFLGAGVCAGTLPTSENLARELASAIDYPLSDWDNLARVSQFAIHALRGSVPAKRKVLEILRIQSGQPGYRRPPCTDEEPHRVLARLPLKLYITTNYDDYLFRALADCKPRARREHCRWYDGSQAGKRQSPPWKELSTDSPLVFHLHGSNDEPASLVVTENDYVDFLMNIGRHPNLVPPCIQGAITGSSLLFIGYGLRDWSFRVLYRTLVSKLMKSQERVSFTVQLPPLAHELGSAVSVSLRNGDKISGTIAARQGGSLTLDTAAIGSIRIPQADVCHIHVCDQAAQQLSVLKEMQEIMATYHKGQMDVDIRIFWGTAQQFTETLWTRWASASALPGTSGDARQ